MKNASIQDATTTTFISMRQQQQQQQQQLSFNTSSSNRTAIRTSLVNAAAAANANGANSDIITSFENLMNYYYRVLSESENDMQTRYNQTNESSQNNFFHSLFCFGCNGPRYRNINLDQNEMRKLTVKQEAITHSLNYFTENLGQHLEIFTFAQKTLLASIYIVFMILGIFSNLLMLYVFYKAEKLRTLRNVFIINLAISDILLCMIGSPLLLMKYAHFDWTFGRLLCKLEQQISVTNVMVTTFCIITIAVDRWQYIVHPGKVILNKLNSIIYIVFIWLLAFIISLPVHTATDLTIIRLMPENRPLYSVCEERWASPNARIAYSLFVTGVQYFVPLIIVSTTNLRICRYLVFHVPSIYSYSFKRNKQRSSSTFFGGAFNSNRKGSFFNLKKRSDHSVLIDRNKLSANFSENHFNLNNNNTNSNKNIISNKENIINNKSNISMPTNMNNHQKISSNSIANCLTLRTETTRSDSRVLFDEQKEQREKLLNVRDNTSDLISSENGECSDELNNNSLTTTKTKTKVSAQTQTSISTFSNSNSMNCKKNGLLPNPADRCLSTIESSMANSANPNSNYERPKSRTPTICLENNNIIILGDEGHHEKQDSARFKRSKYLLFFVSLSFGLCWLPTAIMNLSSIFFEQAKINSASQYNTTLTEFFNFNGKYIIVFTLISNLIATSSSIINPILYGLFNTNFKEELVRIINNLFARGDDNDEQQQQEEEVNQNNRALRFSNSMSISMKCANNNNNNNSNNI